MVCLILNFKLNFKIGQYCYLENENIYIKLNEFLNMINQANPNLSIDEFLRKHLFLNTTLFFREKYSNNSGYINSLNGKIRNWLTSTLLHLI